ncbi:MAG: aldo/keto reductase [Planctomycetaceae bacterium]
MQEPSIASIRLSDGSELPRPGLGTWKIPGDLAPSVIENAVRLGYRHFDCACDYGNEPQVGAGLSSAIGAGLVRREELWITSKLWNTYHEPKHVRAACERSLRDLQLEVLDLYLVHFPISLAFVPFEHRYPPGWFYDPGATHPAMKPIQVPYSETWGAMEELVKAGLVRRIGVCNLNISMLREVLAYCSIRPLVHQVEMHPYLTQPRLKRYCDQEGIAVAAFSPLGADSYVPLGMAETNERVLDDPRVARIAAEHGRTAVQVVLRWAVQRGTVPIPKSQSVDHLRENLAVFDFELSSVEMQEIDSLNRNRRFNDPAEFGEKAFNTFFPIFD